MHVKIYHCQQNDSVLYLQVQVGYITATLGEVTYEPSSGGIYSRLYHLSN